MIPPRAWRTSGTHLPWKGHSLFVREEGQGQPLLLLHAFPTSSWDWQRVWPELAASHRVIAFDYLGYGFSDKPRGYPYSVLGYADQAEAVLAHLGVERAHVLAHDVGVSVACELLARDDERRARNGSGIEILSVCFLNGGLFPELHRARLVQKALFGPLGFLVTRLVWRGAFDRGLAEVFGPETKPSRQALDGYWECAHHGGGLANYHLLIRYMEERRTHRDRWVGQVIHEGPVPICFVNGLLDPVSGRHVIERLRKERPALEIHELPRVGHYPQEEDPAGVLAAYARFRAGVEV
jgi:pimeloyl-ACP methyl ester carboxylesterase